MRSSKIRNVEKSSTYAAQQSAKLSNAMITQMISTSIYVLDLERAVAFYTGKLGFIIHTDIEIEPNHRWVSVCAPAYPDQQFLLIPVEEGMLFSREQVKQLQSLIKQQIFSCGVFRCTDITSTFEKLKTSGVQFIMEPGEGFLNQYEAAFVDDSGNWFRLTQDVAAC